MSTIKADTLVASDGTSPATLTKQSPAKSWIRFDGTGTVAISDSFNISSLTDDSAGTYIVTSTNSFDATTYSPSVSSNREDSTSFPVMQHISSVTASAITCLLVRFDNNNRSDVDSCMAQKFGDLA